jgi:glucosamine--fructose-6-phosphate aminotransferase (isomerizing)
MCGIVGGVSKSNIAPTLLEGLKRLEYRGYDSAGMVVLDDKNELNRVRALGKVKALEDALAENPLPGDIGIAHTRWATHGKPSEENAHPHVSKNKIAVVHNGIIENHEKLRVKLQELGYEFSSQTDTEVVVHLIHHHLKEGKGLLQAVRDTVRELEGAYALGIMSQTEPEHLIATRKGSPLVIGIAEDGHYIASDILALLPVTRRFMYLKDGDIADIRKDSVTIYDAEGNEVVRPIKVSAISADANDKAGYRHYMLKEIYEQPQAVANTLEGRIVNGRIADGIFGPGKDNLLSDIDSVLILACGTSFHAGYVAKYWMEAIARIPCHVEVASEFRYRDPIVKDRVLVVTISQSGQTADTLAALQLAKQLGSKKTLAICNVAETPIPNESDAVFLTHAGPEIGVASTKAFTTQLVALAILVIMLGRTRKTLSAREEMKMVEQLETLPGKLNTVLGLDEQIQILSEQFFEKEHALYLGRGTMYPIAMEGALKLKEISYIHAEAFPAGDLKHGPLALIDENMPVVAVAPLNGLIEKLKSNIEEVRARGGQLFIFADPGSKLESSENITVFNVAPVEDFLAPIIYTIPLQFLAYYAAVLRGTDIDQPRNLAKSVTVE